MSLPFAQIVPRGILLSLLPSSLWVRETIKTVYIIGWKLLDTRGTSILVCKTYSMTTSGLGQPTRACQAKNCSGWNPNSGSLPLPGIWEIRLQPEPKCPHSNFTAQQPQSADPCQLRVFNCCVDVPMRSGCKADSAEKLYNDILKTDTLLLYTYIKLCLWLKKNVIKLIRNDNSLFAPGIKGIVIQDQFLS